MSEATPVVRFVPAPGWPEVRPGTHPPQTWIPSHLLPAPPAGWLFYLDAYGNPADPPPGAWRPPAQWPQSQSAITATPPMAGQQFVADQNGRAASLPAQAPPPTTRRKTSGPLVVTIVVALAVAGGVAWWNLLRPGPTITADQVSSLFEPAIGEYEADGRPVDGPTYAASSSWTEGPCGDAVREQYRRSTAAQTIKADGVSTTVSVWPSPDAARSAFNGTDTQVKTACATQQADWDSRTSKIGEASGRLTWHHTEYRPAGSTTSSSYIYCQVQYGNVTAPFVYLKSARPDFSSADCKRTAEELQKRMDALAAGR
ncbi:MAG: hypothetical protein QM711_04845 [Micropruina sp.]|uniref:hypothetical protein n=1 Tax=Micropruina sp. TaxID=2737536 RepID=UPI0039E25C73